jgi:hypothetical protein
VRFMAVSYALQTVGKDQKRWSLTASRVKNQISRSRLPVLVQAISGTVLVTLSGQIPKACEQAARSVGYAGAATLASIAIILHQYLTQKRLQEWLITLLASEALKRELYRYRTSTGPYHVDDQDTILADRRDAIFERVRPVQALAAEPPSEVALANLEPRAADECIRVRLRAQADWYRNPAGGYSGRQARLGTLQFCLALASTIFCVFLASPPDKRPMAWVAVGTTIISALSTHVLAQRYEQLTISYRPTADRMDCTLLRWTDGRSSLEQMVEQCESALAQENLGWITNIDEANAAQEAESAVSSKLNGPAGSGSTQRDI